MLESFPRSGDDSLSEGGDGHTEDCESSPLRPESLGESSSTGSPVGKTLGNLSSSAQSNDSFRADLPLDEIIAQKAAEDGFPLSGYGDAEPGLIRAITSQTADIFRGLDPTEEPYIATLKIEIPVMRYDADRLHARALVHLHPDGSDEVFGLPCSLSNHLPRVKNFTVREMRFLENDPENAVYLSSFDPQGEEVGGMSFLQYELSRLALYRHAVGLVVDSEYGWDERDLQPCFELQRIVPVYSSASRKQLFEHAQIVREAVMDDLGGNRYLQRFSLPITSTLVGTAIRFAEQSLRRERAIVLGVSGIGVNEAEQSVSATVFYLDYDDISRSSLRAMGEQEARYELRAVPRGPEIDLNCYRVA